MTAPFCTAIVVQGNDLQLSRELPSTFEVGTEGM